MDTFLMGRIDFVKAIVRSEELDASYEDCALITCAVLSACAAQRWPGTQIDKKRFIEMLVRYSDTLQASKVSVPALLNASLIQYEQTPYRFPESTTIFCDEEIDLSFDDARTKFPDVPISKLRDHCYASLIYERLRCAYSHEYRSGKDMITMPASRRSARVSYIGRGPLARRMICFHLEYLIALAEQHVSILPPHSQAIPVVWWSDMN